MTRRRSCTFIASLACLVLGCTHAFTPPDWLSPSQFEKSQGGRNPGLVPLWASGSDVMEAYRVTYVPAFGRSTSVWIERRRDGIATHATIGPRGEYEFPRLRSGSRKNTEEDWQRIQFYIEGGAFWDQANAGDDAKCNWGIDGDSWHFEGYRAPQQYVVFDRFCPDTYLGGLSAYLGLVGPGTS